MAEIRSNEVSPGFSGIKPRTREEIAQDNYENQGIVGSHLQNLPTKQIPLRPENSGQSEQITFTGKLPIPFRPDSNVTVNRLLAQGAKPEDFLAPGLPKKKPTRRPNYGKKG